MRSKKKVLLFMSLGVLGFVLIILVLLNVTHFWKNNGYRFTNGNHLHLAVNGKELFWFDVKHSNNPDDIMYKLLEEEIESFAPNLVLVEGGAESFEGTREEAMREAESSFGAYLAKETGIPVEDIEPPFAKQISYLQEKYSPDEIFAMYTLRQIGSIETMPEAVDSDFDTFALDQIRFLTENGLDYIGASSDDVLNTLNKYLSQTMDKANWLSLKVYRVYARDEGIINDIYNDVYEYRNIYLVELIQDKKQSYNKIFIVMGGQHLIDTKEELQVIYS